MHGIGRPNLLLFSILLCFQYIWYYNNWPQNRPVQIRPLLPGGDGGMNSKGDHRQRVHFLPEDRKKKSKRVNNLHKWRNSPKVLEPFGVLFIPAIARGLIIDLCTL